MKLTLESILSHRPFQSDRLWKVKVKDVKGLDLAFNTSKEAHDYKRLLRKCTRQLEAKILRQETYDGYQTETEVR